MYNIHAISLHTILVAIFLSGCAGKIQKSNVTEPKPTGWQEATRKAARSTYLDPYSVRDAEISDPILASAVFDGITPFPSSGWLVCIRANAKNRFGAYTGKRTTGFLFKENKITKIITQTRAANIGYYCGSNYKPFKI